MNAQEVIWLGLLLFVAGLVFGVASANMWRETMRELEREQHRRIVTEQGQEIARLRAQVALHIGKEK